MISSRTPEGTPNFCPVCGQDVRIDPSTVPLRDAPCPQCGCLLHFPDPGAATQPHNQPRVKLSGTDAIEDMADMLFQFEAPADGVGPEPLLFDFGEVLLSSSELGKLIVLHKKSKALGRPFVLVNINPNVREVLRITQLDQVLSIEP